MNEKRKIGDVYKTECTAIGRYIGNGQVLYVSAMTNDLSTSKAIGKKVKTTLPLPSDEDVKNYLKPKHHCSTCKC